MDGGLTMDQNTFHWLMGATLYTYIEKGLEDMSLEGRENLPKWIYDLKAACKTVYYTLHPLRAGQLEKLKKAESEEFKERMKTEISFIVFAMEVAKLWAEHGAPNVITRIKRIKMGANEYVVPLLRLKLHDKESYAEKHQIVQDSKELARYWFDYWRSKLDERDKIAV
jgi:hypothetical protein